jgi:hypothetical protein
MNEGSESLRAVRVRTRTTAADAHTLLAGALVGVREFAGGAALDGSTTRSRRTRDSGAQVAFDREARSSASD